MSHWTEMVEHPCVDHLARFDVEPVIEPGKLTEQDFTQKLAIPIDKQAFESLQADNSRLFLFGEIAFSDLLGADYVQSFCFAYNFKARQFVRWTGNYNKRTRSKPSSAAARGRWRWIKWLGGGTRPSGWRRITLPNGRRDAP